MQIIMSSKLLKITKIIKKTKAKMFKDLRVGDIIQLSIPVKRAGIGRNGSRPSHITIVNINNNQSTRETFNNINKRLDCFELIEVQGD